MNRTDINTELPENQQGAPLAPATHPPYAGVDPIRAQAYEIASRIGNIAILMAAIFDKLDDMNCDTPADHKINDAITCFANAAIESARAIRSSNDQILSLTRSAA